MAVVEVEAASQKTLAVRLLSVVDDDDQPISVLDLLDALATAGLKLVPSDEAASAYINEIMDADRP